jgi:hypothetical protein
VRPTGCMCEGWNAIMWAGAPAMPSLGDPRAEPTIGQRCIDQPQNGRAVTLGRPLVRVGGRRLSIPVDRCQRIERAGRALSPFR